MRQLADERDLEMTSVTEVSRTTRPDFTRLVALTLDIHSASNSAVRQYVALGEVALAATVSRMRFIGGVAALVGLLISYRIGSSILRSIHQTSKALHEVAEGDLTIRLGPDHTSEFKEMARDFDETMDSLKHALGTDDVDWNSDFGGVRADLSRVR